MSDLLSNLGLNIRHYRKLKKLTIEQLSFLSGINKNYISDLERGKRNPTVVILDKLSESLDVTIEKLFQNHCSS